MLQDRGTALMGLGIGAGLMYFFDPERGRRRRALVRDRVAHTLNFSTDAAATTRRDLAHRAAGTAARVRSALRRHAVDDVVLIERVRAQLGRVVSHPHAIDVKASDGRVMLRGPILQAEVNQLLRAVERVDGVRDVVSVLEEHKEPGNVPSLQGGHTPHPPRPDVWQRQCAPTTRLLVGAVGAAATGYGASRRDVPGGILAAIGAGLVARATTNLETRRLTGIGARRRAIDLQKTITIDAPVETVFNFWTAYDNFPLFMSRVLDVRPSGSERQSHWKVTGPVGVPVEFDAEVSSFVPNQAFGWRTVKRSPVAHAGLVRFEPTNDGHTRVHVRMSYNPAGGWFGHGIAAAFGVDPKSSLDADLARMKTVLETGRPARDAAQSTLHYRCPSQTRPPFQWEEARMSPNPQTVEEGTATFSVTNDDPSRPLPGQPFTSPGEVAAKELAPDCITVAFEEGVIGTTLFVYVVNRCDRSYRINLIVSGAPDSGCFSIDPGQWYEWKFGGFNVSLDRVERC